MENTTNVIIPYLPAYMSSPTRRVRREGKRAVRPAVPFTDRVSFWKEFVLQADVENTSISRTHRPVACWQGDQITAVCLKWPNVTLICWLGRDEVWCGRSVIFARNSSDWQLPNRCNRGPTQSLYRWCTIDRLMYFLVDKDRGCVFFWSSFLVVSYI